MKNKSAAPDLPGLLAQEATLELPPPSAAELRALRKSMAADGVLVPVVVSHGPACEREVADGRARLAICSELGIACPQEERSFASEAEFRLYRLSTNVLRRELTVAHRIRFGMALEPLERARAAGRRAQARGKTRGEKALPVALPGEKGETRERVARTVGLKPSTYERGAKVLREGSAALVSRLEAELETVNSAYRKLLNERLRAGKLALAERITESPPPLPDGRYPIVVLDPPWPYENLPYPAMSLEAIAAIPVPDLVAENAVVWLWTTNRFLEDAVAIAKERWGLSKRNVLTWDKERVGTGRWLRGQTEHCLLLTRGEPLFRQEDATTLIRERAREHSRKPETFYALVERTCPGAKLELFARERRPGWEPWGAEVDYFPARPEGSKEEPA
jgi:N6-adenosine-specific RNA methylase IME4/ParB-like chromosome segregation protein Spo0J